MTEICCQARFVPRASLLTRRLKSTLMAIRRLCDRLLEVLIHVHTSILAVAPLYPETHPDLCVWLHEGSPQRQETPPALPCPPQRTLLSVTACSQPTRRRLRSSLSRLHVLHRCILSSACRLSRDGGLTSNEGVDNTNTHKHEHSYLTGELGCFIFVLFLVFFV